LLLAIVADVDAGRALLAHDRAHGFAPKAIDRGRVDRLAARAQDVKPRQLARPRQAAGVRRQYAPSAVLQCPSPPQTVRFRSAPDAGKRVVDPRRCARARMHLFHVIRPSVKTLNKRNYLQIRSIYCKPRY
jgi:hypothetical protein